MSSSLALAEDAHTPRIQPLPHLHRRNSRHICLVHAFISSTSTVLSGTTFPSLSILPRLQMTLPVFKVFLTLGLAFGLGTGIVYVPSIAVTAHHFRRRRALAMGIAAAGTSLGALLHPIMLNNIIHGSLGFSNGVRASAGLVGGVLLLGGLLCRTRLPPKTSEESVGLWMAAKKFSRDSVYVFAVLGYVLGSGSHCVKMYSSLLPRMQDISRGPRRFLPSLLHPALLGPERPKHDLRLLLGTPL